jgi:transglutaminase-like putative cysteine protease
VGEFVREIGEAETLPFLTALNRRLFEAFRHVIRDDGPANPPEVTLREREGTCRDLAVLFCSACRSVGIAARFVSGYESGAVFDTQAQMHAWAEVYLMGGGWRGYDPSQGLAVSTGHVAVAAAADPRLAAPISGSYRGAAASDITFAISMQVEE